MLTYAYLIKAKAKATEAKNLFCWFSAKSDSRAEREILNILEDNDIAVGRGADYQLPVRTNWFDEPTVPPVTPELITVATLPLRQRLLAQFISDEYAYHIDTEQKKTIQELELDVDNSYVQNLLLAAENVEPFRKAPEIDIWKIVSALKTIFPVDGKRVDLSTVIQFFKAWFNTEHIDRGFPMYFLSNGRK